MYCCWIEFESFLRMAKGIVNAAEKKEMRSGEIEIENDGVLLRKKEKTKLAENKDELDFVSFENFFTLGEVVRCFN